MIPLTPPRDFARRLWLGGSTRAAQFLDLGLLALLVGGLTLLFDRNPEGWLATNPTPLFLLPLLMGGRYGVAAGLVAGLCAALLAAAQTTLRTEETFATITARHLYPLVALPLAGLICGEIQRFFAQALLRSEVQIDHHERRLRSAQDELQTLAARKDELDATLAFLNADVATLDRDLARALQTSGRDIFCRLLDLLQRRTQLRDGAFYRPADEPERWQRVAWIGGRHRTPDLLVPGGSKVVATALAHRAIASLPMVWEPSFRDPEDFLFACPLVDAEGRAFAVLTGADLPVAAMSPRTLELAELVCRWAACLLSARGGPASPPRSENACPRLPARQLAATLDTAWDAWRQLQLPSSLIAIPSRRSGKDDHDSWERLLAGAVRPGDLTMQLHNGGRHRALLLPLTGRNEAEECAERLVATARSLGQTGVTPRIIGFDEIPSRADLGATVTEILEAHP